MLNPRDLSASHWCITYWKMFGVKCKYRYPNSCVVCGSLIGHWFHFEKKYRYKAEAICISLLSSKFRFSTALSKTWSRQWEWGRIVFFVMHTVLPWQLVTTLHSEYPRYTHCITCYMCSTAAGTNQTFTWNYDDGLILTSSAINSIDDSMLHITHSFTLNCQPWTVTLVSRILGHQIILLHPPTLAWRW